MFVHTVIVNMEIVAFEGCGNCGMVSLRIPHKLLADMLKNCEESYERDKLIDVLRKMRKSANLSACLDSEHILSLIDGHKYV